MLHNQGFITTHLWNCMATYFFRFAHLTLRLFSFLSTKALTFVQSFRPTLNNTYGLRKLCFNENIDEENVNGDWNLLGNEQSGMDVLYLTTRVYCLCLLNNLTVLHAFIALSYSMHASIQYKCNISACLNERVIYLYGITAGWNKLFNI